MTASVDSRDTYLAHARNNDFIHEFVSSFGFTTMIAAEFSICSGDCTSAVKLFMSGLF